MNALFKTTQRKEDRAKKPAKSEGIPLFWWHIYQLFLGNRALT
jgi:hypothetical protein